MAESAKGGPVSSMFAQTSQANNTSYKTTQNNENGPGQLEPQ